MTHPTISKSNDERSRLFTNNVITKAETWRSMADSFADTKPILGVELGLDETMERGIRPGMRATSVAMFDGIVMDIVTQRGEFLFVTHDMLPEPALPNRAFVFLQTGRTLLDGVRWGQTHPTEMSCSEMFNQAPPSRKVGISGRKRPHHMQMVRHQNERVNSKRTARANVLDGLTQSTSSNRVSEQRVPLICDGGKKEGPTKNVGTNIGRHVFVVGWVATHPTQGEGQSQWMSL